jgi:hypothetical protein
MKQNRKKLIILSFGLIAILLISILNYNAVDKNLTKEDIEYIPLYIKDIDTLSENSTYLEELDYIIAIQKSVLDIAPHFDSIPFFQKREPKELYFAKSGLCYDRSRVIEKILIYSRFETRHISIYSTQKTNSAFKSLITPGITSHAVTEVHTKKGWLVIDSNAPWVSIDIDENPISIQEIQNSIVNLSNIPFFTPPPSIIYKEPFTFVYGLYSRHGKLYPPYNDIPDINYKELTSNIL